MKLAGRPRNSPIEETPAFAHVAEGFRRSGDLMRAVSLCQDGLRRFPDHVSGRVTLGWALLDLERYEEAQQELQHALKRAPDNLLAIRGLAHLHEHIDGGEFHGRDNSDHAEEERWLEKAAHSPASDESSSEHGIDEEHADALAALDRFQREESRIVQAPPADPLISVESADIAGETERVEAGIETFAERSSTISSQPDEPEPEFAAAPHFGPASEFEASEPAVVADPAVDVVADDGSVEQELLRLEAMLQAQADSGLDRPAFAAPVATTISPAAAPVAQPENVFSEPEISSAEPDLLESAFIHDAPDDTGGAPVDPPAGETVAGQLAIEDSGVERFVPELAAAEPVPARESLSPDMAAGFDVAAGPSLYPGVDRDLSSSENAAASTTGDLDSLLASVALLEPVADGLSEFGPPSEPVSSPSLDGIEPVLVAVGSVESHLPSMPAIAALEHFLTQVQNRRAALG
jgi:hypothetical protein